MPWSVFLTTAKQKTIASQAIMHPYQHLQHLCYPIYWDRKSDQWQHESSHLHRMHETSCRTTSSHHWHTDLSNTKPLLPPLVCHLFEGPRAICVSLVKMPRTAPTTLALKSDTRALFSLSCCRITQICHSDSTWKPLTDNFLKCWHKTHQFHLAYNNKYDVTTLRQCRNMCYYYYYSYQCFFCDGTSQYGVPENLTTG